MRSGGLGTCRCNKGDVCSVPPRLFFRNKGLHLLHRYCLAGEISCGAAAPVAAAAVDGDGSCATTLTQVSELSSTVCI